MTVVSLNAVLEVSQVSNIKVHRERRPRGQEGSFGWITICINLRTTDNSKVGSNLFDSSFCLSVMMSIYLCLLIHWPIYLSFTPQSINQSISQSVNQSISQSVNQSIYVSTYPSICLPACPPIYLPPTKCLSVYADSFPVWNMTCGFSNKALISLGRWWQDRPCNILSPRFGSAAGS